MKKGTEAMIKIHESVVDIIQLVILDNMAIRCMLNQVAQSYKSFQQAFCGNEVVRNKSFLLFFQAGGR